MPSGGSPVAAEVHDLVVVGAGPAGSCAAWAAARAGARVLVLDRATFPRYKTCGGGLIGATLRSLPPGFEVPVRQHVHAAGFSLRGGRTRQRRAGARLLPLVDRAEFDEALLHEALRAGAQARLGTTVTSVEQHDDTVVLTTDDGAVRARWVIGADGSASRVARHVGVRVDQVDLGLESEVVAGPAATGWAGRIHLDWGPVPGSYAWIFPKGDLLTVGVIARRGTGDETRGYLRDFLAQQGLAQAEVAHTSGHLTRCRTPDSPLGRGRVLVCGDAAGLLEPWTREGISFAVRSGTMAGSAIGEGSGAGSGPEAVLARYTSTVERELLPEMAAGAQVLRAFERHPTIVHLLLTTGHFGWHAFARLTRGQTTIADVLRRPVVRAALRPLIRE